MNFAVRVDFFYSFCYGIYISMSLNFFWLAYWKVMLGAPGVLFPEQSDTRATLLCKNLTLYA